MALEQKLHFGLTHNWYEKGGKQILQRPRCQTGFHTVPPGNCQPGRNRTTAKWCLQSPAQPVVRDGHHGQYWPILISCNLLVTICLEPRWEHAGGGGNRLQLLSPLRGRTHDRRGWSKRSSAPTVCITIQEHFIFNGPVKPKTACLVLCHVLYWRLQRQWWIAFLSVFLPGFPLQHLCSASLLINRIAHESAV